MMPADYDRLQRDATAHAEREVEDQIRAAFCRLHPVMVDGLIAKIREHAIAIGHPNMIAVGRRVVACGPRGFLAFALARGASKE